MGDEPCDSNVTPAFECRYCHRRFTKKEHLKRHERAHTGSKPFRCSICERSFSRGDVLKRHHKSHGHSAPSACSLSKLVSQSSCEDTASPGPIPLPSDLSATTVSAIEDQLDESEQQNSWSPVPGSGDHNATSFLLWPDSEDLFQSLISADGVTWGSSLPGLSNAACANRDAATLRLGVSTDQARYDDIGAAEGGRQAVHTVNGLLTNTLLTVASHAEIGDLTPQFLDSSLHMFFTKFVPVLPIIHRPTFVFRECSAPLLLNAAAIGSLFLGTEKARVTGERLWKLAYTAIATSWSDMIGHYREFDHCNGIELVQTALLSQAYAALSPDRTLRMTSQTFYGLSLHWAQYCGMYDIGRHGVSELLREYDTVEAKTHAWRSWAAKETQLRTLLGLCIVDGVVSQFSSNPVNTWQSTSGLVLAAHESVFAATTADEWVQRTTEREVHSSSNESVRLSDLCQKLGADENRVAMTPVALGLIDVKVMLEILAPLVSGLGIANQGPAGTQVRTATRMKALNSLRRLILSSSTLTAADKAVGLLRWHAVCLDLGTSTARGARRMCSHYGITQHVFGGMKRQESKPIKPYSWAHGLPARICLLHALEIHKIAADVPLGVTHDTSLPGALFAVATTYASFALPGFSKICVPGTIDWDTVLACKAEDAAQVPKAYASKTTSDTLAFLEHIQAPDWSPRNLLYELSSLRILLQGLSQYWGVTREMVEVIAAWEMQCI